MAIVEQLMSVGNLCDCRTDSLTTFQCYYEHTVPIGVEVFTVTVFCYTEISTFSFVAFFHNYAYDVCTYSSFYCNIDINIHSIN